MGFEPTTFSLARRRSTTEPRPHGAIRFHESAESQNRTDDTAIFSRVLYQLSYLGLETFGRSSGCDFTRTDGDCQAGGGTPFYSHFTSGPYDHYLSGLGWKRKGEHPR